VRDHCIQLIYHFILEVFLPPVLLRLHVTQRFGLKQHSPLVHASGVAPHPHTALHKHVNLNILDEAVRLQQQLKEVITTMEIDAQSNELGPNRLGTKGVFQLFSTDSARAISIEFVAKGLEGLSQLDLLHALVIHLRLRVWLDDLLGSFKEDGAHNIEHADLHEGYEENEE